MGVAVVVVLRLLVPLAILRWPFWGAIAAIAADTVDVLLFQVFGFPGYGYHETDKLLDLQYMTMMLIAAQRWEPLVSRTASALFAFRLVGVALFEISGWRLALFVFPNLFEMFFLLSAFVHEYRPAYVLTPARIAAWLAVLLLPKMLQEYLLHYSQVLDNYSALEIIRDTWRDLT
jgi:hypothetical protein